MVGSSRYSTVRACTRSERNPAGHAGYAVTPRNHGGEYNLRTPNGSLGSAGEAEARLGALGPLLNQPPARALLPLRAVARASGSYVGLRTVANCDPYGKITSGKV
jgi:hypothetical protein